MLQKQKFNTSVLLGLPRRFFSYIRAENYDIDDSKKILQTQHHSLSIVPLMENNTSHYNLYKHIITKVGVFNTSSWIMGAFGKDVLNIKDQKKADEFFKSQEHIILQQYKALTKYNVSHQAGYYTIIKDGTIVGGSGLIPVGINQTVNKVYSCDLALHILPDFQKNGYGKDLTLSFLTFGFDSEKGLDLQTIVGTSLKSNYGTSNLCQQFGMVIKSKEDLKYYYINRKMWDIFINNKDNQEKTALGNVFLNNKEESKQGEMLKLDFNPQSDSASNIGINTSDIRIEFKREDENIEKTLISQSKDPSKQDQLIFR